MARVPNIWAHRRAKVQEIDISEGPDRARIGAIQFCPAYDIKMEKTRTGRGPSGVRIQSERMADMWAVPGGGFVPTDELYAIRGRLARKNRKDLFLEFRHLDPYSASHYWIRG